MQSNASLLSLPQETVKYPCILQCHRYDQDIRDKALPCNIPGWL